MRFRTLVVVVGALVLAVLAVACEEEEEEATPTPTETVPAATETAPAATPTPSAEPINIVAISPLAGAYAPWGEIQKTVTEIMVDEWNATGGILDRPVNLTYHNDQGDTQLGLQLVEEAISRENPHWLLPQFNRYAAQPLMKEHNVLGSIWDCDQSLTVADYPYMFASPVEYTAVSEAVLKYLTEGMGAKKIAYLYASDFYSPGFTTTFEEEAKNFDVELVVESFAADAIDTTPQLIKLREANPDVLMLVALAPGLGQALKDRVKIGWDIPVVGEQALGCINLIPLVGEENLKDVRVVSYKSGGLTPDGNVPADLQDFLAEVEAKVGGEPPFPFYMYVQVRDMLQYIKVGFEGAQSTDPDKVKAYLESLGANPLSPNPFWQGTFDLTPELHCPSDACALEVMRADLPLQDGLYTVLDTIPGCE